MRSNQARCAHSVGDLVCFGNGLVSRVSNQINSSVTASSSSSWLLLLAEDDEEEEEEDQERRMCRLRKLMAVVWLGSRRHITLVACRISTSSFVLLASAAATAALVLVLVAWTEEPYPDGDDGRWEKNNRRAMRKAEMSDGLGMPRARSVEQYWMSGPAEEGRMSISRTFGGDGWSWLSSVSYDLRALVSS